MSVRDWQGLIYTGDKTRLFKAIRGMAERAFVHFNDDGNMLYGCERYGAICSESLSEIGNIGGSLCGYGNRIFVFHYMTYLKA